MPCLYHGGETVTFQLRQHNDVLTSWLDITTPTLKSYLQRIKKRTGKTDLEEPPRPVAVAVPNVPGAVESGRRRSQKATSANDGATGPAGGAGSTKVEFIGSDRERL